MDSVNRGLDLEKELTCSICTEVLFQPLTLLDCLHTFCGACLKEWFSFQLTGSRDGRDTVPTGSTPYTCPSCRAPVRETKHNATVTTLLEMFLAANPDKGKTTEEREELKKKYIPGEDVIPKVEHKEKSLRERRAEDEERRQVNEATARSLREAGVGPAEARNTRRRRDEERSGSAVPRSRRETSRGGQGAEDREHRRRPEGGEEERRRRRDGQSASRPSLAPAEEHRQRRSQEDTRRRQEQTSRTAARQIEHQSSLRSLISSSDVDSHEMEEEILRQIQEEGLLDGIDLENIDINQQDQISERIAEAFRRRQRERARADPVSSSDRNPAGASRHSESREQSSSEGLRASSRHRTHSRSTSATSQVDEQSRPTPHANSMHLEIRSGGESRRRRTTSGGRSSTAPIPASSSETTRPAARSQTDLSDRPRLSLTQSERNQITSHTRSSTETTSELQVERPAERPVGRPVQRATAGPAERPAERVAERPLEISSERSIELMAPEGAQQSPTLGSRAVPMQPTAGLTVTADLPTSNTTRSSPPGPVYVPASAPSATSQSYAHPSLGPVLLSPRHQKSPSASEMATLFPSATRPTSSSSTGSRTHSPRFPEPSLNCARCTKPHIEYELHYNCYICHNGEWNICLSCYRNGRGCLQWFGFGYARWNKWDRLRSLGQPDLEPPHALTANRYLAPKISPGGADGRRTITSEDPQRRLQSGAFCANCLAWANECYWRCDTCNEDEWGFCNTCVNQGKCCTHPLLPLTYKPEESSAPPISPTHDQQAPPSATLLTGPGVMECGPFKPLTFRVTCDICRHVIQPSSSRYHCFSCTSSISGRQPGDYDICTKCYNSQESKKRISQENGHNGWRRCLQGHRMIIVGFEEDRGGQRRVILQDLVGGRGLREEPSKALDHSGQELQQWTWAEGSQVRLVTIDVSATAPTTSTSLSLTTKFPPVGGLGMKALALWPWYPEEGGGDDELLFPKMAELRECVDLNGDWFWGVYMGAKGLFPAPYVKVLDKGPPV